MTTSARNFMRTMLAILCLVIAWVLMGITCHPKPVHAAELRFTTNPHANKMRRAWNIPLGDSVWVQDGCKEDTTRRVSISGVRVYRKGTTETKFRQIAWLHPAQPLVAEKWTLRFVYADTGEVYVVQERSTPYRRSCRSEIVKMGP